MLKDAITWMLDRRVELFVIIILLSIFALSFSTLITHNAHSAQCKDGTVYFYTVDACISGSRPW